MPEIDKRTYFNGLAGEWDNLRRWTTPRGKCALRLAERGRRRPVLDVGCGTGILLAALLEQLPVAECVVEVDFAVEMLRENARKFADRR